MDKLRIFKKFSFKANNFQFPILLILMLCCMFSILQAQNAGTLNKFSNNASVAVDGEFAVVGNWWQNNYSGVAYIWQNLNGEWVKQQKLSPSDLGTYDHFGSSVTINGDEIMIGAPWQNVLRGAVYVYKYDPRSQKWIKQEKLINKDGQPDDQFGRQLKLTRNRVSIATYQNDTYEINKLDNSWDIENKTVANDITPDSKTSEIIQISGILKAIPEDENLFSAIPEVAAAPDPVSSVTATDGIYEDKVEIRWDAVSEDAIIYKILRNGNLISIASSDESLFDDFFGDPGSIYTYSVVVVNMLDEESTIEDDQGSRIIYAPENVIASDNLFDDHVTITWTDRSEVEVGYLIKRGGNLIETTAANVTSYDDMSISAGVLYLYSVTAIDENNFESQSVSDNGTLALVTAPSGVQASYGTYADSVVITWINPLDEQARFVITRNGTDFTTEPNATRWVDEMPPDGIVQYEIQTMTINDLKSTSIIVMGGINILPPAVNVAATDNVFDDKVEITWTDNSDLENGFKILRDDTEIGSVGINVTAFTDLSGTPGTQYNYAVKAFSNLGGEASVNNSSDAGKRAVIVAPSTISASDGTHEDRVTLNWQTISTTTKLFKIFRDATLIKTVDRNTLSYDDFGATAGVSHSYYVTGVTALNISSANNPADNGQRDLKKPTSVNASDELYEDRVLVTWTENSTYEDGYFIYRKETGQQNTVTLGTLLANRSSYLDLTGIPGTIYEYSVAAFDSAGGAIGQSSPGVDEGYRIINPPTEVSASQGEYENKVEVWWTDNSNAENGYYVFRDAVLYDSTLANVTNYTDPLPTFGAIHNYRINTFDAMGISLPDSADGNTIVLAPVSFDASDEYFDKVTLSWVDVSNIEAGYKIYRDDTLLDSTSANADRYQDSSADPGFPYNYSVRAFKGTALSDPASDTGTIPAEFKTNASRTKIEQWATTWYGNSETSFGSSIAVSGVHAVVGAPASGTPTPNGRAFVLKDYDSGWGGGGLWGMGQELVPSDPNNRCRFGIDVAIDGNYAVVGAYEGDIPVVYIFRWNGSTWAQHWRQPFQAAPEDTTISVDIDGLLIAIGIPGSEIAHVYTYFGGDGSGWTLQEKLTASNNVRGDKFGQTVAIDGDQVIVGAPGDDNEYGVDAGAAYAFKLTGHGITSQQQRLIPADLRAGGRWASTAAIDGEYTVIGGTDAAHVYKRTENVWFPDEKLTPSLGSEGDAFGSAVAIDGNVIIVGASKYDHSGLTNPGAAYAYTRYNTTGWSLEEKITDAQPINEGLFGRGVAVDNGIVHIGGENNQGGFGYRQGFSSANLLQSGTTPGIQPSPQAVSATDGRNITDRVQIQWQDVSAAEDGYRIYRDDNDKAIVELGVGTESYEDFTAIPGRSYRYSVVAFSSQNGESTPASDFGRIPADGNITGRVSTRSGAGVDSVEITLDPAPNKAILLDGAGGHVRIANNESFNFSAADDFTIETWVKYTGNGGPGPGTPAIIEKWDNIDGAYPFVLRANSGQLNFAMYDGSNNPTVSTTRSDLNDGVWHHVACVHDASAKKLTIHIDGSLDGTHSYSVVLGTISNTSNLFFGTRGNRQQELFAGQIDETRIWKIVLDPSAIFARMNRRLAGDENDLVGYWRFDEGVGAAAADLAKKSASEAILYGSLENGAYFSNDGPPLNLNAFTDIEGNYAINELNYGARTTFNVKPSKGSNQYEPAYKAVTLSSDNPVQNEIGFIDITSYTLSGIVSFAASSIDPGAQCFVENVEILLDGVIAGVTDKEGRFSIASTEGRHTITARLGDHTFEPAQQKIDVISDQAGVDFTNTTTRTLSGRVAGGSSECNIAIGTVNLEISSENTCFNADFEVTGTSYNLLLPPQKYFVRVNSVTPPANSGLDIGDMIKYFDKVGAREVDLTSADSTLDFIYHAPLKVLVSGFETYIDASHQVTFKNNLLPIVPILVQGPNPVPLIIQVYEDYGIAGMCPVDTGTVKIIDAINDKQDEPKVIAIKDGVALDTTYANTPNITYGGRDENGINRSFQKQYSVTVEVGANKLSTAQWVIVEGHKPRKGSFVTATSDNMPLIILRDPPGDASNTFLEESTTFTSVTSNFFKKSQETGVKAEIKTGVSFEAGTPFFSTDSKTQLVIDSEFKYGIEFTKNNELQISVSTTDKYSTSEDEVFVGREGDVYIGAAMNYVFAKTDVIKIDRNMANWVINQNEDITFGGTGFETTYQFTDYHIRHVLIPQLEELRLDAIQKKKLGRVNELTGTIENWWNHLNLNKDLLEQALESPFAENISFSGGAHYEYTHTSDTTRSFEWAFQVHSSNESAAGLDFKVAGTGAKVQFLLNMEFEYQRSKMRNTTESRSVGYSFDDDNIGDYFSVDVAPDPAFQTPVFKLREGVTSSPWEMGPEWLEAFRAGNPLPVTEAASQPRDWIGNSTVSPAEQNNVPEDGKASFTVGLVNESQSGETREYHLRAINPSNPGGAVIEVNGARIGGDPVSFFLPHNVTQEMTVSVARGPSKYTYDDLQLMIYAPFEYDRWRLGQSLTIVDTIEFSVQFEAPCSDITLLRPQSNWIMNSVSPTGEMIPIVLSDFELNISEEDSIDAIGAEYREFETDTWFPIMIAMVDTLSQNQSEPYNWDISGIPDGKYEIRAYTVCSGGNGYSSISVGTIDRTKPVVFGNPQPADQVLNLGENISITFNEKIKSSSVNGLNVHLTDVVDQTDVIFTSQTNGRTIVISPEDLIPLEGRLIKATISGIEDTYGNTFEGTYSWQFTVQINQFAWSQASINKTVPFRNPGTIKATLVNGSPIAADYDFSNLPVWLTPDPVSGTLKIGGSQIIEFIIDENIVLGEVSGIITASATDLEDTDLEINLIVDCIPPTWNVDPTAFQYNMNIVSQLNINSTLSSDINDKVSAYVGTQLRGTANIEFVNNKYLAFITVYSNIATGESVRFHVWDDSDCLEYDATVETFTFTSDATFGTPKGPRTLTAILSSETDSLQIVQVNEGWTWFSMNVTPPSFSVPGVLSDLNPTTGNLIKSQTGEISQYDASLGWQGTLNSMDNVSSFMINLSEAGAIVLDGDIVDPSTTGIPIHNNWNWIGYTPQVPFEVNVALNDLKPSENDIIKSQTAFAHAVKMGGKDNYTWFGNLTTMEPGKGYRLYLKKADLNGNKRDKVFDFNYPANPVAKPIASLGKQTVSQGNQDATSAEGFEWSVDPWIYQYNMTVIAVVEIDGSESKDVNDVVGAFVDGECRGFVQLTPIESLNRYEAFLMIHSNKPTGEKIEFRIFDADRETELEITESMDFVIDASYGLISEPVVFSAAGVTSIDGDGVLPDKYNLSQNYPNPFNPSTTISFGLPEPSKVLLEVYNVLGQKITTLYNGDMSAGYHEIVWNTANVSNENLCSGLYLIKMQAGSYSKVRKMMFMK